ncbi:alpha-L-arabinofuranosidase 1-like protein, partial [Tanacetum coccineum]
EINHAGAGGLWAELVNNRGFEAGGQHSPSLIDPWSLIGDDLLVRVSTDLSSPFKRNPVALRMEVLCDKDCPAGGVGIFNPGYWGMNIEQGKTYNLVLYVRSPESVNVSVSLTDSIGVQSLASTSIIATDVSNWTKVVAKLEATATNKNARLQLQTNKKGVIWFDQVSLMPTDTYKVGFSVLNLIEYIHTLQVFYSFREMKISCTVPILECPVLNTTYPFIIHVMVGHGFRNDLFKMVQDLEPAFIRFP